MAGMVVACPTERGRPMPITWTMQWLGGPTEDIAVGARAAGAVRASGPVARAIYGQSVIWSRRKKGHELYRSCRERCRLPKAAARDEATCGCARGWADAVDRI